MASQLFYIVSVSVGLHDSAIFEIASDLPFPTPIDTERFLDCEDDHLHPQCFRGATVRCYEHRSANDWENKSVGKSTLLMFLAPPQDDGQLEYYVVKENRWAEFREQMKDYGWDLVEQSDGLRAASQDQ